MRIFKAIDKEGIIREIGGIKKMLSGQRKWLSKVAAKPHNLFDPQHSHSRRKTVHPLKFTIFMLPCMSCGLQACTDTLSGFVLFCFVLSKETSSLYWENREDASEGKLRI